MLHPAVFARFSTVFFYGVVVNADTAPKYWEKTRHNNLVRHTNGRYYARLYRNGKEKWQSLKTTHYSVAEAKLAELQKEHRQHRERELSPGNAKLLFGEAAQLRLKQIDEDVSVKGSTRNYAREVLASLLKSWPGLDSSEVRRISPSACQTWAAGYAKEFSATRYNGTVSFLRSVFALAIENGIIHTNPADKIKRKRVKTKTLELPSLAKFAEFVREIRHGGGRHSKDCAELVEGLAFTGMRKGEAREVAIADLEFKRESIRIAGDPEGATKNGEIRHVPMIPQARNLFSQMLVDRHDEEPTAKVFRVAECQKAMDRAAKKVGMTRITHHDLRHLFATVCIESGVDIPTVSRWLGHKDGGALAMKTYGHLRREHSLAQAKRVSFVSADQTQAA
jgi:integrase